ncbi:hypothetical protein CHGG_08269 [Chaetomium globosum CBS 148.51]|uniref:Uncharacterized protein n=1 Tax=Chaetomium globosum (strain ATCC 6205 / CBS 148.51 / DSM 1962 / NBRC 6347 / NRRL 1970) TaxID=306901 RepID=Q2GUT5_CHAGB|nr:uncharacterized protein CHGG_08269 [Chaetomium globosum CBS 148.51]EAQ87016.1 hypothetical protein CHGG_08269 [Chaetomium globosum CBS 148.51]
MTHESFLAATVLAEDGPTARAILCGVTESRERHYYISVRHYKPQNSASQGLSTIKQLQKERRPTSAQWHELHQILVKQPSVVQVRTDVTEEAEHIMNATEKLQSDLIEESYCWWLEGIEYSLTRMFVASLNPDPTAPHQVPNPKTLQPVGNFWILYVRAKVDSSPAATMPDRVKQAQAQLVRVQEQFKGVFDFPKPGHTTLIPIGSILYPESDSDEDVGEDREGTEVTGRQGFNYNYSEEPSSCVPSSFRPTLVSVIDCPLIPLPGKPEPLVSSGRASRLASQMNPWTVVGLVPFQGRDVSARANCDEGKPTCKRCEKSRRECGGYRPEFEIVHRDQTGSTVRRLRKAGDAQHQHPTTPRPFVFIQEEPQPWRRRQSPSPSPVSALTIPIAHRASCYFASNFILVPVGVAPHGFMEYLVPLMDTEPPESALRYAFNACAFALLGNRARADGINLAQLSLKEHTMALAQTHKALGHPAAASTDSTLAAVLLLCLYETRGREDMCRTRLGALLFTAVRHHLVSRVLSSGLPLPFGTDWWMAGGDTGSLFANCQRFNLRFSELRAEANRLLGNASRSPESLAQMHETATRIQDLDQEVADWLVSIPDEFRFRTVCLVPADGPGNPSGSSGEKEAFPGRVDVYPDFVSAMAWNMARVSRLLLASLNIRIAARVCSPADYRTTPEYKNSKPVCESTIADIIASVPYHLGWRMHGKGLNGPGLSTFACGEEGTCKALPALFLIWTLTCVKNHDMSTEEQRGWAKGRLKFIAEEVGLKYAHIVNEANLRFPSMMIRKDGMLAAGVDPLQVINEAKMARIIPPTPESMTSPSPRPSA